MGTPTLHVNKEMNIIIQRISNITLRRKQLKSLLHRILCTQSMRYILRTKGTTGVNLDFNLVDLLVVVVWVNSQF